MSNFKVIELAKIDRGNKTWLVECLNCHSLSKRCKLNSTCGNCHFLPRGTIGARSVFQTYKGNSKKFDLSFEQFIALTSSNCTYCNSPPKNLRKTPFEWGYYKWNGIDRVNSELEYTPNNCVPCCTDCNWAKGTSTLSAFKEYLLRFKGVIRSTIELPTTLSDYDTNRIYEISEAKVDIVGKTINCWEVLEYCGRRVYNDRKTCYWKVRCINCGIVVHKELYDIKNSKICRHCKLLPKGSGGLQKVLTRYKKQATKRNIRFYLTSEEFKQLTSSNCYYCKVPPNKLSLSNKDNEVKISQWGAYLFNGVDRIDNTKDYTIDNCVSCCETCNRVKNNQPLEQFMEWINQVKNN